MNNFLVRGPTGKGLFAVLAGNLVIQALSMFVVLHTMMLGAGSAVAPGIVVHFILGSAFAYFIV